jgi:hypothetical protein
VADILAWLEASGLGTWVRESPSLWAYPAILTLHSVGLGILVGASVVVDLQLLGRTPSLGPTDLTSLFPVMWSAFALNATTGLLLFAGDATRKGAQPVFYVKLACIAAAVLLLLRARTLIGRAGSDPSALARPGPRAVVAVLSLVSWLGALTAGRLMAYL